MAAIGRGSHFDVAFNQAFHARPGDEIAFLQQLAAATASTPSDRALILTAFAMSGITLTTVPANRHAMAVAGGWRSGPYQPALDGHVDPLTGITMLTLSGFEANAPVLLDASAPPSSLLATPLGAVYLDLGTLSLPTTVHMSPQGSLSLALPATLATGPTALQALAFSTGAPGDLLASNGLYLQL